MVARTGQWLCKSVFSFLGKDGNRIPQLGDQSFPGVMCGKEGETDRDRDRGDKDSVCLAFGCPGSRT